MEGTIGEELVTRHAPWVLRVEEKRSRRYVEPVDIVLLGVPQPQTHEQFVGGGRACHEGSDSSALDGDERSLGARREIDSDQARASGVTALVPDQAAVLRPSV